MTKAQPAPFKCPNRAALYEIVRVEAADTADDREITRRACGGPLDAREGTALLLVDNRA